MADDRVFVDTIMEDLLKAEAKIVELHSDLINYRDMVAILLQQLASQNEQVERLMWRLRKQP